jgi:hypothetical protein
MRPSRWFRRRCRGLVDDGCDDGVSLGLSDGAVHHPSQLGDGWGAVDGAFFFGVEDQRNHKLVAELERAGGRPKGQLEGDLQRCLGAIRRTMACRLHGLMADTWWSFWRISATASKVMVGGVHWPWATPPFVQRSRASVQAGTRREAMTPGLDFMLIPGARGVAHDGHRWARRSRANHGFHLNTSRFEKPGVKASAGRFEHESLREAGGEGAREQRGV